MRQKIRPEYLIKTTPIVSSTDAGKGRKNNMVILLTGGAGYIGSHVLISCLEAGHQVVVADDYSNSSPEAVRRVEQLSGCEVPHYQGDIRDAAFVEQIFKAHPISAVMHFAGLKAVGESVAQPLSYYDVNVAGTVTLLKAMAAAGVYRLVFSSTAAVYGNHDILPLTEESPLGQPSSPYGRSKLMVEDLLADLSASDPRWSISILRYFNPAGAHASGCIGEDPRGVPANLIPYAMQVAIGHRASLAVFGTDYPTPDGTGVRDYIHVMDLAEGHLAALDHMQDRQGFRIWNLGSGAGYSVRQIIEGMEAITGKPLPWQAAPRRPGDTAQYWADPARAAIELGWRTKRDLQEMLRDHLRWQMQNPKGYDT